MVEGLEIVRGLLLLLCSQVDVLSSNGLAWIGVFINEVLGGALLGGLFTFSGLCSLDECARVGVRCRTATPTA